MPRSFWSGAVRFGLVNIPVTLHPASEALDLDFDLVDVRDFSPVGYRKVNKNTGREVPKDKIVKTFKVDEGEAVIVTDEDFARARPKGARSLEISGFLKLSEIPVPHFDTPYFLEPAGKDAHAYVLLHETLEQSKMAAMARGVLRTRERLGAIFAQGELLYFNTLRFPHEMRRRNAPEALARVKAVTKPELEMARRLIEEMQTTWKPAAYRDEYREELLSYIRQKAKAGESRTIYEPAPEEAVEKTPDAADLMQLLKRSLGAKPGRKRRSAS